jgi:hypothetical protein
MSVSVELVVTTPTSGVIASDCSLHCWSTAVGSAFAVYRKKVCP